MGRDGSRGGLLLAASAITLWLGALIVLAACTSNPATLNRVQFEQSAAIVTGRVVDRERGRVVVERWWTPGRGRDEITVRDLSATNARSGLRYVLPLSPLAGGQYEVTRPELPQKRDAEAVAHKLYPPTEDVLRQLRELLEGDE